MLFDITKKLTMSVQEKTEFSMPNSSFGSDCDRTSCRYVPPLFEESGATFKQRKLHSLATGQSHLELMPHRPLTSLIHWFSTGVPRSPRISPLLSRGSTTSYTKSTIDSDFNSSAQTCEPGLHKLLQCFPIFFSTSLMETENISRHRLSLNKTILYKNCICMPVLRGHTVCNPSSIKSSGVDVNR